MYMHMCTYTLYTYKEIYYEEPVSVVTEAEKSQDQLSASWGPRRADPSDLASRQEKKNPMSQPEGRQAEGILSCLAFFELKPVLDPPIG